MMKWRSNWMSKFVPEHEYDMYSQMQPVFGYYVDDDPKSATFGEVLFGQIGERNAYNDVLEFKDETDISYIKKQLLKVAQDSDWNAELDEESAKELNENEKLDDENSVEGGSDVDKVNVSNDVENQQNNEENQA